ncbi:chromosome segregation protein SMC [Xanthomonas campestris]|nr:chromosome segregation protein SMC [Xanthomonas campestris]
MENTTTAASVEGWLDTRASWLRVAAQNLVSKGKMPDNAAIDALADHCHAEATGKLPVPYPSLIPGIIQATPVGPKLRINKLSHIHGVNAFGPRAELNLSGDLTVVYGPNGAGKSGYARLMKHMCGAKTAEPIYGNVFATTNEPVSATVRYSAIGMKDSKPFTDEKDVVWQASQGTLQLLASVHVFDSATATHLGQTASTATHLPRTMRFVNLLIDISDQVAERLRLRTQALVSTLPPIPVEFANTQAAAFHKSLVATTTIKTINEGCQFTEAQLADRVGQESALAQADPAVAYAKVIADLQRIKELSHGITAWAATFGDDLGLALADAQAAATEARQAAIDHAKCFLDGIPLPGVGEKSWQRLWMAAADFAKTAYPEHVYPNIDEGARCVLCQQSLELDAKKRMADFTAYVTNQLQSQAAVAEKTLTDLIATIPGSHPSTYWLSVALWSGMTPEAAILMGLQIDQRLARLRAYDAEAPQVDWNPFQSAVESTMAALTAERDILAALIDPTGREHKHAQLLELRAQEWVSKIKDAVLAEVDRKKHVSELENSVRLAQTHALTKFSNEVGKSELAGGFVERFNTELKALGGTTIPVNLVHKLEGKGIFSFSIGLDSAIGKVKSRDVLSEGEQRVVALAAFLADVTGTDRSLPVIFDDPISSLDQRFEEAVTARLVELAKTRQTIVFTHRLSMGVLIEHAAEKQEAKGTVVVDVVAIDRKGTEAGVPATIKVFTQSPKKGLNDLDGKVRAAMKLDDDQQQELLKAACGNFRILVERVVEDHLCAKVVMRYRREIKTNGMLNRLTVISKDDCALIEKMMTKYSAFEHAQPYDTPLPSIDPHNIISDIADMSVWIREFEGRAAAA